jgi:hypothetical protein
MRMDIRSGEHRRHRRTTRTGDLFATVWPPEGGASPALSVADLSVSGMRVKGRSGLHESERVRFELAGSAFRFAGAARVVHAGSQGAGLAFLSWDGPAQRPLAGLLARRG